MTFQSVDHALNYQYKRLRKLNDERVRLSKEENEINQIINHLKKEKERIENVNKKLY